MSDAPGDDAAPLADLTDVDLVELTDGAVPVMRGSDGPYVVLRHAVNALGLDYRAALRMLRSRSWARVVVTTARDRHGRSQEMITTDADTFRMYLVTVNEVRLRPELRGRLVVWQCETRDALAAYWSRGIAVNPRGRTPEEVAILETGNAALVSAVAGHLSTWNHWDAVAEGRRDMPVGESVSSARRKANGAVRRAYRESIGTALRSAQVDP